MSQKIDETLPENFATIDFSNMTVDPNYRFSIPAGGEYLLGVSPVDEGRYIVPLVRHAGFVIASGADGDSVTWQEESLYIDRFKRWLRVFRFKNNSQVTSVSLFVSFRLL